MICLNRYRCRLLPKKRDRGRMMRNCPRGPRAFLAFWVSGSRTTLARGPFLGPPCEGRSKGNRIRPGTQSHPNSHSIAGRVARAPPPGQKPLAQPSQPLPGPAPAHKGRENGSASRCLTSVQNKCAEQRTFSPSSFSWSLLRAHLLAILLWRMRWRSKMPRASAPYLPVTSTSTNRRSTA